MARNQSVRNQLCALAGTIASTVLLTGCFTGVENTKTITLSRQDIKQTAPSAEDLYLSDIQPTPLKDWQPGKAWYVADDRMALLLVQRTLPYDVSLHPHRGDTLRYLGRTTERHPDGSATEAIRLSGNNVEYLYDTHMTAAEADTAFNSFAVETLIDLEALRELRQKMTGQQFWTRSSLWYDADGNNFSGLKYVPVTVTAVTPGSMVFPVTITFATADGTTGNYYMSLGNGSRRYATLFYLDDLKKRYPRVDDDVWQLICHGKVRLGMTKQECRLALGNPLDSDSGRTYSSTLDIWKYDAGRYLRFEDGILVDFRQ